MGASKARRKKRKLENSPDEDNVSQCGVSVKKSGLHVVTVVPSSVDAKKISTEHHKTAHLQKLPIYNLAVASELDAIRTTTDCAGEKLCGTNPAVESLRSELYWKLRHRLTELCKAQNVEPVLLAFERWQFRCKLQDEQIRTQEDDSRLQDLFDPLFPTTKSAEDGLLKDLERSGLSTAAARQVAIKLASESLEAAASVKALLHRCHAGTAETWRTVVETHKHTLDFYNGFAGTPKRLLKITKVHYNKLRALWQAHKDSADETMGSAETLQFHNAVLCVLLRYNALSGHGFQAAAGEHVFETLRKRLGADMECFASPLNCSFGHFCSAFGDTDAIFGSKGSFFAFRPKQGSFQANPPFVPELMDAMYTHMEGLLSAPSAGPLSFSVVVPGWTETPSWGRLEGSPFNARPPLFIAKEDHGYCDGAQHQRQDRFRDSPYDTAVFFLQNEKGAARWHVGAEVESELKAAFAKSLPSALSRRRIAAKPGGGRMKAELKGPKMRKRDHK